MYRFDFLGTFTEKQSAALFAFAEARLPNVTPRLAFIKSEIERLGWIRYEFNSEGERVNYSIEPVNSMLAKYARAYEYYGGDLTSLQIRSRGDWIYLQKGVWDLDENKAYAGGTPSKTEPYQSGNRHLNDTAPAIAVAKVKDWLIPAIKRREDLEFRIKRTVDLSDQYIEEVVKLVLRSSGAETIAHLRSEVDLFIASDEFPSAGV